MRNVPRIRDVEAMLDAARAPRRDAWSGAASTRSRSAPPASRPSRDVDRELSRAHPRVVPAGRPAAGALRPRRSCRRRAATSSAAGASIRTSTPSARSARRVERPRHRRSSLAGGLRAGEVFMDEPSVMGTENALMAAALTPGETHDRQRRLRAARQDLARMLVEDGRRHPRASAPTSCTSRAPTSSAARRTTSGPTTSRSARSWRMAGDDRRRDPHQGHRARRPADDPPGLRAPRAGDAARRRRRDRPRRPEARRPARHGRAHVQGPGRPVAGVPGRPDLDRRRAGDPERGRGARPRVDVRDRACSSATS